MSLVFLYQLWKEITVNPNANLVVQNYTIIEDAEQAIHWMDGGAVVINSSIFNRNGAGVHLETNFYNIKATKRGEATPFLRVEIFLLRFIKPILRLALLLR
ncbi:MAG: hypothetical protein HS119_02770 [Flavobacteriales bacterium]|nr:hypothetical protein [Flavobacteriales bacterium]